MRDEREARTKAKAAAAAAKSKPGPDAAAAAKLAAVAEDTDDKGSLPFDQLLKDAVDVRVWRWWRPA